MSVRLIDRIRRPELKEPTVSRKNQILITKERQVQLSALLEIYNRTPIPVQHALTSGAGLVKARKRYGKTYYNHRRWLEEYDKWPIEQKISQNSATLVAFLKFVNTNSRYYNKLYTGINLEHVMKPEDLCALPIVDKEMLRTNINDVYTVPKRKSTVSKTGGTTGKPLSVRYTFEDEMRRMAVLDHFKSRHGFENRKMLKASFGEKQIVPQEQTKPVFWRYNHGAKQFIYSTFHLNQDNAPYYVRHLNKVKPRALDGFITPLVDIAQFIENHNLNLEFRPLAIFPTAETVWQEDRELLERVFQCKVYDQYASSEGAPFLTECSHGSMHVELSTGVFEQLPESDEILVTGFDTHGTPLVRYRIGDSMRMSPHANCSCGVDGPTVESIFGRSRDFLRRRDRSKVSSLQVANILKSLPSVVIKSQVVQKILGEITFALQIDEGANSAAIARNLRHEAINAFGQDTVVNIEFVDAIPKAPSGKHQLVRNLLPEDSP